MEQGFPLGWKTAATRPSSQVFGGERMCENEGTGAVEHGCIQRRVTPWLHSRMGGPNPNPHSVNPQSQ